MSEVSGKFKAEIVKFETSQQDADSPYIKVLFKMKDEWDGEEWSSLSEVTDTWVSQLYSLRKTKKNPEAKDTAYNVSVRRFKKDFGVDLTQGDHSVETLGETLSGKEKVLILEEDLETKYHKIKWINNLSSKKEGQATLQSLL